MKILSAWVGEADIHASRTPGRAVESPILAAINALQFDEVCLLSAYDQWVSGAYMEWLERRSGLTVNVLVVRLPDPNDHDRIYMLASRVVESASTNNPGVELTYYLGDGWSAMAAIWILLARTRYPGWIIDYSTERGVKEVRIPFEPSPAFAPVASEADNVLTRLMQSLPGESPAFTAMIHRCTAMNRAVDLARRLALRDVPVLIQGESGTGKELFARTIHQTSARSDQPFVHVNCGAIPHESVNSGIFGDREVAGYVESADRGTLFLADVDELPLTSQVRLLRVLQDCEVTRARATEPRPINVRIIAATNRVLPEEIQAGRFREDLYYRLAVGVLLLPPLRERDGDLDLLIDARMASINVEAASQPGYGHKELDAAARKILIGHSWPGNLRELHNVLLRASIWASGDTITEKDISASLVRNVPPQGDAVLGRSVEQGMSLPDLMADVARHYLERAMAQAEGNKTAAARLLGLGSYQTLNNWLKKYEVE